MWVHFGFGRIGKAAISQFLKETNQDYSIVDRKAEKSKSKDILIESNNESKLIKGISISRFDNLDLRNVSVISTSVTTPAIESLIPQIKTILESTKGKIYIVPFENDLNANKILEKGLSDFSDKVIVLEAMIDMIVSNITNKGVEAEMNPVIKIDERINNADINKLSSEWTSRDVSKEHIVKFYLVNGIHAAIAYFGLSKNMKTIDEVVNSNEWSEYKDLVVEKYVNFLVKSQNLDKSYLINYADRSLKRFSADLGDTVQRVGRDPSRKTSKGERLDPVRDTKLWKYIIEGSEKL